LAIGGLLKVGSAGVGGMSLLSSASRAGHRSIAVRYPRPSTGLLRQVDSQDHRRTN
jgi:hypothetical protein